ncbi:MAG: FecR family protein [Planctomycetota bacterium]
MDRERFEVLLDLMIEGDLSRQDCGEFEELLSRKPELVVEANDRLAEHRLLGMIYQPFESSEFADSVMQAISIEDGKLVNTIYDTVIQQNSFGGGSGKSIPLQYQNLSASKQCIGDDHDSSLLSHSRGMWALLATVLFMLVCTLAAIIQFGSFKSNDRLARIQGNIPKMIGTVLLSQDSIWETGAFVEGARLPTGNFHLKSGLAVFRFDGGVEIVLRGSTKLELISAGSIAVEYGNVIVRAEDAATGFKVITPSSEVIDLGTEFSLTVNPTGETEVDVLEGEVSVRPLNARKDQKKVLSEGNAVVVDSAESKPRATRSSSERFDMLIAESNPAARADLMYAYEGFFYEPGPVALAESTRGKGWVGPWRKRTDSEGALEEPETAGNDSLDIVHGQMNVTWPIPGGELGMLRFPAGKTFRARQMERSIDLSQDGVYFFSLMVREPDLSDRPAKARPRESMRLTFRSTEDYFGEALSFGISQRQNPQIKTGIGVGFYSPAKSPSDQTTLWVGKIIARANGEDEVSFRVFSESDPLGYAEPFVWHVNSRKLELSAKLDLVLLTSTGLAPRVVDELRIGPTWRSVIPMKEAK